MTQPSTATPEVSGGAAEKWTVEKRHSHRFRIIPETVCDGCFSNELMPLQIAVAHNTRVAELLAVIAKKDEALRQFTRPFIHNTDLIDYLNQIRDIADEALALSPDASALESVVEERTKELREQSEIAIGALTGIDIETREWEANKLGGVEIQRRWQRLGAIARNGILRASTVTNPSKEGGEKQQPL